MGDYLKSLSTYIGIFGRTNVGKSTLINYISGQNTSIVSNVSGTTTDVVYKTMELSPIGPITLIDTAGLDDISNLSKERIEKTYKVFDIIDVAIIIIEPNIWTIYEENIIKELSKRKTNFIILVNNYKSINLNTDFTDKLKKHNVIYTKLTNDDNYRENFLKELKKSLLDIIPEETLTKKPLTDKIIKSFQTVVLVVPIDLGAPKGRLILPQVQMIRACLDINAIICITKETELQQCLKNLSNKPDIVICDSQVIKKVIDIVPNDILVTTFSIIFSANRADFSTMLQGINAIKNLTKDSKILIAEACSHHASKDDIGRVKIPNLLNKYLGFNLKYDIYSGIDFPKNITDYSLIIHCGGCMINKKQMVIRQNLATENNVPITNYGVILSFLNNVLDRVIKPFNKTI